jgi:DNA-binding HxlR family transcriptional regulator
LATSSTLLAETHTDIARVSEALAMLTPRWTVRILLITADGPRRSSEIARALPGMPDSQLHLKLRALVGDGLLTRTKHGPRAVSYRHTERAAGLLPVLPHIVAWAEEHLEQTSDRLLPAIDQIEDTLTLLSARHIPAILWALKARGQATAAGLAATIVPASTGTGVYYPPLRQLLTDGLVDNDGPGRPYRLSEAGEGLAPVLAALSAWSAGRPLTEADRHPLWGRPAARSQRPAATPPRSAPARIPATTSPAWRPRDLFSHAPAARPAALPTAGPRR